jgi:hypothetical protein
MVIEFREDGCINATQLCKAGQKEFSNWYKIISTKELINELEKELSKPNLLNPRMGIEKNVTHY